MNELLRSRLKKRLQRLQSTMHNLELLPEEDMLHVFAVMDGFYNELCFINDKGLNEHITKFDARVEVLDQNILNANKAVSDAFKQKIDFYKEAYRVLLSDL